MSRLTGAQEMPYAPAHPERRPWGTPARSGVSSQTLTRLEIGALVVVGVVGVAALAWYFGGSELLRSLKTRSR